MSVRKYGISLRVFIIVIGTSPIRSVIMRVINKIGRPRRGSPFFSITRMITDRIGRHKVLLPINHNHYNFRKKVTFRTNIFRRENVLSKKNWKFPSLFVFCYFVVVAIVIVINSVIGGFS